MKRTALTLGALACALSLTLSSSAGAQNLYKWVDNAGKVHYSDKPPAAGQAPKGEQTIAKKSVGGGDNLNAQRELAKKEQEQSKGAKSAKERESESQALAEREKAREKNCALAKEATRVLSAGGRVSVTDEKGERRVLEEKEIAERLQDGRKREEEACAPLPPPQKEAPAAPAPSAQASPITAKK